MDIREVEKMEEYTNKDYVLDMINEFVDINELSLRKGYSGRYMDGSQCIGIVCEEPLLTLAELLAYIFDNDEELMGIDILDILGEPKMDTMALDYILYFPELTME